MSATETAIGIDLGTTNCAVAWVNDQGRTEVLRNAAGLSVTPSVVAFRDGGVVVGEEAKELFASGWKDAAAFFKRQMGEEGWIFYADGRDRTATDLSALLLERLREDAERSLGRPVRKAVITVPAYFANPQREATILAGEMAGLEVLQVLNEPTAAAIAFGVDAKSGGRFLVYDLGGGTFDVTLLQFEQRTLRVLHSEGDHALGGKDWDDRIVEFLASRFEEEIGTDPFDDLESLADLLVRAEEAKKRLSAAERVTVSMIHDGARRRYDLERATFEEITADLMERTIALTHKVLEDQGFAPSDVDGVLLVGGSTRMPMVADAVRRTFGREPLTAVHVDEAVAAGAAEVAANCLRSGDDPFMHRIGGAVGRIETVDVTNHSLGMIAVSDDGSAYVNSIILPKNRTLPCVETRPYRHATHAQRENRLEVFMTQGEAETPDDVTYLGRYVIEQVPHGAKGFSVIDIAYAYDDSGTVDVAARLQDGSADLPIRIESLPEDVPDRFLESPEARVERAHVTAYLAFDLSGSMSGKPLKQAKKAAKGFLQNTDLGHCSLGIVGFADRVGVELEASRNAREIERAIESLKVGSVGIGNATDPFETIERLLAAADAPKFVVTLADGVWDRQDVAVERAAACRRAGIESIAIGFGGADRRFLKRIASADEASFFTRLGELETTFSHIAQVLTETQSVAAAGSGQAASELYSALARRS